MGFWTGEKGKFSQQSTLGGEQQGLYNQLLGAGQAGGGGSFGQAGDYYRDLLGGDGSTYQAQQAPEMRQFREQIIPELSEQFAGMGAGGLSSSGFRNAAVGAGADLSERLGAIRAQLRQQGAQGLMGLGQQGLNQYNENIYTQGQPGALQGIMGGIGQGLGMAGGAALGGGIPAAAGALTAGMGALGSMGQGQQRQQAPTRGSSSPYGANLPGYNVPSSSNQFNAPIYGQR